ASQTGDSNFNPATDVPQAFTIAAATPVVTVTCSAATFNGTTHSCSAAATGIGNAPVSGSSTLTYNAGPAPSNAGTYIVSASFTSGDSNYSGASGTGSLVIAKATPTVNVVCPSGVIFDGNSHVCLAGATGVAAAPVTGAVVITYNGSAVPSSAS